MNCIYEVIEIYISNQKIRKYFFPLIYKIITTVTIIIAVPSSIVVVVLILLEEINRPSTVQMQLGQAKAQVQAPDRMIFKENVYYICR